MDWAGHHWRGGRGADAGPEYKVEAMAERKKAASRAEKRAEVRKSMTRTVRPWPMGLQLNVARIKTAAAGEWNFERLYENVRQFAGSSISREVLQEFLKANQIALKKRPGIR
jgi:hypothetical protein